jgi:hypothetical protein
MKVIAEWGPGTLTGHWRICRHGAGATSLQRKHDESWATKRRKARWLDCEGPGAWSDALNDLTRDLCEGYVELVRVKK